MWYLNFALSSATGLFEYIQKLGKPYVCEHCHCEFETSIDSDRTNDQDPFLFLNLKKIKQISHIYTFRMRTIPRCESIDQTHRDENENLYPIYGVVYNNRTLCIHCYKTHEYDPEKKKEYRKEK